MYLPTNDFEWTTNNGTKTFCFVLFKDFVLFGGEAMFHQKAYVNQYNLTLHSTTNPQYRITHGQTMCFLSVSGGIVGNYVIVASFFEAALNCEVYLNFLANCLSILLENFIM